MIVQQLIEKINREKVKIFDLQQNLNTYQTQKQGKPNQQNEILNYDSINLNDLQKFYSNTYNENTQLEEKIYSLVNKLNNEKEKIFDLKFNIECKVLTNTIQKFKINSYDAIAKTAIDTKQQNAMVLSEKPETNGLMTKL